MLVPIVKAEITSSRRQKLIRIDNGHWRFLTPLRFTQSWRHLPVTVTKLLETSNTTNQTSGPSAVQHRTSSPRHFPKAHAQFNHPYTALGHFFRFTAVFTESVSADEDSRHMSRPNCVQFVTQRLRANLPNGQLLPSSPTTVLYPFLI